MDFRLLPNVDTIFQLNELISQGLNPTDQDAFGNNLLHQILGKTSANTRGETNDESEMVGFLLQRGIDVNAQNIHRRTPLFNFLSNAHVGDSPDWINYGWDRSVTEYINRNYDKRLETVKCLLDQGADPTIPDILGLTVPHYCAVFGCWKLLKLMLPYMKDNICTISGESVADYVDFYGRIQDIRGMNPELKELEQKPKRNIEMKNLVMPLVRLADNQEISEANNQSKEQENVLHEDGLSTWSKTGSSNFVIQRRNKREMIFYEKGVIGRFLSYMNGYCKELLKAHEIGSKFNLAHPKLEIDRQLLLGDFHLTGTCSNEYCQIACKVSDLIQQITSRLAQSHPEFRFEPILVGSSADGSKMFFPNEFDFLLVYQLENDSKLTDEWISILEQAINDAIQFIGQPEGNLNFELACCVKVEGKVCYKLGFIWRGVEKFHISIDLTPVRKYVWGEPIPVYSLVNGKEHVEKHYPGLLDKEEMCR